MKKRLRKARNLINRYNDSWGSRRHLFKLRIINRRIARKALDESL